VALDVADIEPLDSGLRVTRSKVDQEGEGTSIAIAPCSTDCPTGALAVRLASAGIVEGPVAGKVSLTRVLVVNVSSALNGARCRRILVQR